MTFPRHPPPSAADQAPDGTRPLSPSLCPRVVPRSHGLYSPFLLPCPPYPYPCPWFSEGQPSAMGGASCSTSGHSATFTVTQAKETSGSLQRLCLFPRGRGTLWWGDCVVTRTDICVWHVGLLCFVAIVQCSRGLTCQSTCYLSITGMHRMFGCRASWWLVEGHGREVGLKGWGIVRTRFNRFSSLLRLGFKRAGRDCSVCINDSVS